MIIAVSAVLVVSIIWFVWALCKDARQERVTRHWVMFLLPRARRIDPEAFAEGGFVVYYPKFGDTRQEAALKLAENEYYAFLINQQKRGRVNI